MHNLPCSVITAILFFFFELKGTQKERLFFCMSKMSELLQSQQSCHNFTDSMGLSAGVCTLQDGSGLCQDWEWGGRKDLEFFLPFSPSPVLISQALVSMIATDTFVGCCQWCSRAWSVKKDSGGSFTATKEQPRLSVKPSLFGENLHWQGQQKPLTRCHFLIPLTLSL